MSNQDWVDLEKGPWIIAIKVTAFAFGASVLFGTIGYGMGWFSEAATVAQDEFGPRETLKKYSWFKDAAAQLEKKLADIEVYETRVKLMEDNYKGADRKSWDRTDKETMNQWQTEMVGVKASYNSLAGEYNANMAKFHWSFAEAGKLPPGAETPLPREFKLYVTN